MVAMTRRRNEAALGVEARRGGAADTLAPPEPKGANQVLLDQLIRVLSGVHPRGMTTRELSEVLAKKHYQKVTSSSLATRLNMMFKRYHGDGQAPTQEQLAEFPLMRGYNASLPRRLVYTYVDVENTDSENGPVTPPADDVLSPVAKRVRGPSGPRKRVVMDGPDDVPELEPEVFHKSRSKAKRAKLSETVASEASSDPGSEPCSDEGGDGLDEAESEIASETASEILSEIASETASTAAGDVLRKAVRKVASEDADVDAAPESSVSSLACSTEQGSEGGIESRSKSATTAVGSAVDGDGAAAADGCARADTDARAQSANSVSKAATSHAPHAAQADPHTCRVEVIARMSTPSRVREPGNLYYDPIEIHRLIGAFEAQALWDIDFLTEYTAPEQISLEELGTLLDELKNI